MKYILLDLLAATCSCETRLELQRDELLTLRLLVAIGGCGLLQLGLAIIIPHFTTGLLGLLVLLCCMALALEIWNHRRITYLIFGVMQPLPLVIIAYIDYAMLVWRARNTLSHACKLSCLQDGCCLVMPPSLC